MVKILFYNWDRLDGNAGGGVTVYQKNLIQELSKNENLEIYYLNSGLSYDIGGKIYLRPIDNDANGKAKCYEIVNSPVLAPVQQSIRNIDQYLHDNILYDVIKCFLIENGPFDIIHFNNMEGLSLSVLHLKDDFPEIRFVYSLHNYFPICSRVNLWKDKILGNGHNCDKRSFDECAKCYFHLNYQAEIFKRCYRNLRGVDEFVHLWSEEFPDDGNVRLYQEFEQQTISAVNQYMDCILAVSKRGRDIFLSHGMDSARMHVAYIGTKVAEHRVNYNILNTYDNPFQLIYMGYMRDSKGYYFFIDSLKKLPIELARNIIVTIVARYDKEANKEELLQIESIRNRFAGINLVNGYTNDNQAELLQGKHLGIVPILWEDNLPQVAVEQIAYGVPILCSDLGGASELFEDNRFVFQADNQVEFIGKLREIIIHREYLQEYWKHVKPLMTMEQHVRELCHYYGLKGGNKNEIS